MKIEEALYSQLALEEKPKASYYDYPLPSSLINFGSYKKGTWASSNPSLCLLHVIHLKVVQSTTYVLDYVYVQLQAL